MIRARVHEKTSATIDTFATIHWHLKWYCKHTIAYHNKHVTHDCWFLMKLCSNIMTCVVIGCSSGNGTYNYYPEGVSKHRFPMDPHLREIWCKAIPRVNWKPSAHSVICSLHFEPSYFEVSRNDSNKYRHGGDLKTRRLKKTAVPRIFPGCSSQLSKPNVPTRYVLSAFNFPLIVLSLIRVSEIIDFF